MPLSIVDIMNFTNYFSVLSQIVWIALGGLRIRSATGTITQPPELYLALFEF